jgi:hypothetical protein
MWSLYRPPTGLYHRQDGHLLELQCTEPDRTIQNVREPRTAGASGEWYGESISSLLNHTRPHGFDTT